MEDICVTKLISCLRQQKENRVAFDACVNKLGDQLFGLI
jgi:hypothetical protein